MKVRIIMAVLAGLALTSILYTGCMTKPVVNADGSTNLVQVIDPVKLGKIQNVVEPAAASVLRRAIHNSPQHAQEIGDYARSVGGAICSASQTGQTTPGQIEAAIDQATKGLQVANIPSDIIDAKNALIAIYNVAWDDDLRINIPNDGWVHAVLDTICNSVDRALKDSGQTGLK